MNTNHPIYKQSFQILQEKAIGDVNSCRDGLIRWVEKIRSLEEPRGRFNWAKNGFPYQKE